MCLSDNKIEILEVQAFFNLHSLKMLNLISNQIKHVQTETLAPLFSLEILVLDFNVIQRVSKQLFRHILSLKLLSIKENKLSEIEQFDFDFSCAYNIEIYLQLNHMKAFELSSLTCGENSFILVLSLQRNFIQYLNKHSSLLSV